MLKKKPNKFVFILFILAVLGVLFGVWWYYQKRIHEIDKKIERKTTPQNDISHSSVDRHKYGKSKQREEIPGAPAFVKI